MTVLAMQEPHKRMRETDEHCETPVQATVLEIESNAAFVPVYTKFSPLQKRFIIVLLATCAWLGTTSTTGVLAAVPEIVLDFKTTANAVSISNALYLVFMGVFACLWGPFADIFGRRKAYLCSITLFCAFSLGTALSPNIVSFFVCRALTAAQGVALLILGSSCITDIYHPTERGTALGWFLAGSMSGYALGPVVGGAIITYTSWRVIFWVQAGLSGAAVPTTYFLLRETIHSTRTAELTGQGIRRAARQIWQWMNPAITVKVFADPNMFFVILASSALVWNMYSTLTPVRYVLNQRLNLTTPLQSGLLFLAPGTGYIIGLQIGGRWADYQVRHWMKKRGYRRPEDRLRSCLFFLGGLLPGSMILYGWMVDRRIGGVPVPVISMFFQGIAQTASFVGLNAYILDVMQHRSGRASAAHYMMRFVIAGIGTAVCLPLIHSIGVGWTSTVSAAFVTITAALVFWTIKSGEVWRSRRGSLNA
ncbi:MFS-type transporter ppsE [Exophiala dermatitidis]